MLCIGELQYTFYLPLKSLTVGSCEGSISNHNRGSLIEFPWKVDLFLRTKQGRRFQRSMKEFALLSPALTDEQCTRLEVQGRICRELRDFCAMLRSDRNGNVGGLESYAGLLEAS